ncbi:MAG: transposase, partial [Candidatus Poribacteria bacterium]|nr:transposase [Candidatus Poribacteria bacterium]
MTSRKKYSKEFQLDAVSRLHEQDYSRTEAAKSLEINIQMLERWRKEYQSEDGLA